jgi:hypothetical protein
MKTNEMFFEKLESYLPPFFTRQEAAKHLGNVIAPRTLRNLDNKGIGPGVAVRIGHKVAYERENFIEWLKKYVFNSTSFNNLIL